MKSRDQVLFCDRLCQFLPEPILVCLPRGKGLHHHSTLNFLWCRWFINLATVVPIPVFQYPLSWIGERYTWSQRKMSERITVHADRFYTTTALVRRSRQVTTESGFIWKKDRALLRTWQRFRYCDRIKLFCYLSMWKRIRLGVGITKSCELACVLF